MKLRLLTGLMIAFALVTQPTAVSAACAVESAAGQIPAQSREDSDPLLGREWVSLRAARSADGAEDLRSLPPLVSQLVDWWFQAQARGISTPCIGSGTVFYDPPRGLGRFPERLTEFAGIATTITVGTVREREHGFLRGRPATAFWLDVERMLEGDSPGDQDRSAPGLGFIVQLGSFEFAGYRFCRHDSRLETLPEIGDRLLMITTSGPQAIAGRPFVQPSPGTSAFVIERRGVPALIVSGVPTVDGALRSAESLDAIVRYLETADIPDLRWRP